MDGRLLRFWSLEGVMLKNAKEERITSPIGGTYVNRNRIDSTVLRAGDEVQIGKYRMTFHPSPRRETGGASTPAHS